jgi:hypothetical protein
MMAHLRADRGGKTLLVVLLVVFVVLAIVVFFTWRSAPTQPDLEEGRAVAESFLELVRKGQPQQAWESTTSEFKSAQGRESFVQYVKKHPALAAPLNFVSVQTVTLQNSPRAEYLYRSADGKNVRLLAGNERGTWRVDRVMAD